MEIEMSLSSASIKLSWSDRLRGLFAVIVSYAALRCFSLAKICNILSSAKQNCSREISLNEANIVWESVRQSSFFFSGRLACIELSLAFVLFALTKKLSTTWCVGVATQPFRAHAWIELDGKPFREAEYLEQHFRRTFTV
jgi:hypothetical protein